MYKRQALGFAISNVFYVFGIHAGPVHLNGIEWYWVPFPVKMCVYAADGAIVLLLILTAASIWRQKERRKEYLCVIAMTLVFLAMCIGAASSTIRLELRLSLIHIFPHLIYLKQYDYLEGLNAFSNGWIQVQDMSSSLVGLTASPKENSYIIDVCGAPGGKSLHLADMMKGTGFVDVRDLSPQKIELIEENIERTGFSNIHTKVWDALERDESVLGKADILIADLPCSGLGIIGRKPDIKYNTTAESVESLAALQREILSVVQEYVKPGGLLVYSTCTVAAQENQENARWFQEHFPFSLVSLKDRLGHVLKAESLEQGYVQILPGQYLSLIHI